MWWVISIWATIEWFFTLFKIYFWIFKQTLMYLFLTFMLRSFLMRTLQYLKKKNPMKTLKNIPQRHYCPFRNFQYCQLAQNQPKSHILFDRNVSPRDLYKITLISHRITKVASWSSNTNNAEFLFLLWKL